MVFCYLWLVNWNHLQTWNLNKQAKFAIVLTENWKFYIIKVFLFLLYIYFANENIMTQNSKLENFINIIAG